VANPPNFRIDTRRVKAWHRDVESD